jgi:hypothetical protein
MADDSPSVRLEACPCCNALEIDEIGQYEICAVCGWEDDPVQSANPDYAGGANTLSLNAARSKWLRGIPQVTDLETNLARFRETISAKQEGYVLEGDVLLAQIFEGMNPAALHGLLRSFDDTADHQLMFAMIHAVEAWPDPEYCQALVEALPVLWEHSPSWAERIHIRVLNSPPTLSRYLGIIDSADSVTKVTSRRIFESISKTHPPLAVTAGQTAQRIYNST